MQIFVDLPKVRRRLILFGLVLALLVFLWGIEVFSCFSDLSTFIREIWGSLLLIALVSIPVVVIYWFFLKYYIINRTFSHKNKPFADFRETELEFYDTNNLQFITLSYEEITEISRFYPGGSGFILGHYRFYPGYFRFEVGVQYYGIVSSYLSDYDFCLFYDTLIEKHPGYYLEE